MDWFKDSTLGTIKSMAIDGRVYLIENNSVTKLSGGKRELLSLDEVTPPLEEPTRVSVSTDLDFLYILEPKNHRLLVYSKNGVYKAQYTGDQLTNLKDAVVDQKNRLVYFLNGKSVYSAEAKHLQ
jgi:hypothetical protein